MCQLLFQLVGKRTYARCKTMVAHHRASMNTFCVHKDQHHQGYGSLLLQYAEHHLHHHNSVQIVTALVWQRQGESVHQFYEKNGYTHMPSERQQYYDDGVYVYELMPYVKLLSPMRVPPKHNKYPDELKVHVTDYTL